MRAICSVLAGALILAVPSLLAQGPETAAVAVPHVVQFAGTLADVSSAPLTVKFALYATPTGGEPVWAESQSVTTDGKGRYAVLLGAATLGGLPQKVFSNAEAKWLGITVGDGEESPRTILVATPYALKASDAETLGGHPATDFALIRKDAKSNALTDITQISGSNGVLVNGAANTTATGPTVALSLDGSFLGTLGNTYYAQIGAANTFKGNQTINGNATINGNLNISGSINSAFLAGIAATLPTLTGNNTLSGTNKFTKPVTFASGQTFPGTGTITGVSTKTGLTGGGTSGAVILGLDSTYLNSNYANLAGDNTYTGYNTYEQPGTVPVVLVIGQEEIETDTYTPGLYVDVTTSYGEGIDAVGTQTGVMGITEVSSGAPNAGIEGLGNISVSNFGATVTGIDAGVWGDGSPSGGQGVLGTDDNGIAGEFLNKGTSAITLYAYDFATSGNVFYAGTSGGDCEIGFNGNLACSGGVNVVGRDSEGRARTSAAVTSTENWMEDFGSAELRDGSAVVPLEPAFASMVDSGAEYHVFLTPKGDSNNLYVSGETATSFEVHEAHGGRSRIKFDYRIVAKPRGKQDARLPDVTEEVDALRAQTPKLSETPQPRSPALRAAPRALPLVKRQK